MKRSAIVIARGARTGAPLMRNVGASAGEPGADGGEKLRVSVADPESELLDAVTEIDQQVAGPAGPGRRRVGR